MQIILEHWADIRLKSPSKKVNIPSIRELTGIDDYKGRRDQRKEIMEQITVENYHDMRSRICHLDNVDTVVGSSNFAKFMNFFEQDDPVWIKEINDRLDI